MLLIIPRFIIKKLIKITDMTTRTFVCKQMTKNSMIIRMPNEEIFNGVCMVEQKGRDVPT